MRGKDVFYPVGWDDNGLPTERRVENFYGVRCDPSLPYDPAYAAAREVRLDEDRDLAAKLRRALRRCSRRSTSRPLSNSGATWDSASTGAYEYSTISKEAQGITQRAFLAMLERGEVYSSEAPTLWDIDFRTAVSQAELEDRERPGTYHRIAFARRDGKGHVEIETTRPEMLASCVALVAHPEDPRYAPLFSTNVVTPLFGVEVPILAHELADPDKGTGIAMICTFGDTTDVTWWRELDLPTRALIGRDGRFLPADFAPTRSPSLDPDWRERGLRQARGRDRRSGACHDRRGAARGAARSLARLATSPTPSSSTSAASVPSRSSPHASGSCGRLIVATNCCAGARSSAGTRTT